MLSPELSTLFVIFSVFFLAFAIALVIWQLKVANYCRESVQTVLNSNARSVTLRKMADVEATLTDLTDSYDALLASHKKLRSRIGMRITRENAKQLENGVDLASSTDKTALRNELRKTGALK